jgi:hypothetical protein
MKAKTPILTAQQKTQILGDDPTPKPIKDLFSNIAKCAESGPLTVPLHAISRNASTLNTLFERAKKNPRPVGTGIPILIVTLN